LSQTAKLSGHDMPNTDIGGWNLDVQHKYNFHSGILQKGDGNTVYLKYKPQVAFLFRNACSLGKSTDYMSGVNYILVLNRVY
jgi:hypothetical protein